MISKRLAILMAGQKKQAKDPMVGKWKFTNYNETYVVTSGFSIPKKMDAGEHYFQTNSTYQYAGREIQKMGCLKVTATTGDIPKNRLLFSTNPYSLGASYRLPASAVGTSYIEFDDDAVNYIKSLGVYTELYVCLMMTHVKD